MNRFFLLLLFLLVQAGFVNAEKVVIRGQAKDFAGRNLVFFSYRAPYMDIREEIFSTPVSPDGQFRDSLNVDHSICLYTEAGPYLAYFYVEPGKNYEIELPEISNLPDNWKRNPYFKRAAFHLKVRSTDDTSGTDTGGLELNRAIRKFDSSYEPFLDKLLLLYYTPELSATLRDSFVNAVFRKEEVSDQRYFENYRDYRKAMLEFAVENHNLDSLVKGYMINRRINFQNPAYRNLFEKLFDDYFTHLKGKDEYQDIFGIFAELDYVKIRDYVKHEPALQNDTIFNIVLLHEVYKAFYSGNYDRNSLIKYINSLKENIISEPAELLLKETYSRFTSLMTGYPAPSFALTDIDGDSLRLSDFKGKYVYLGFCTTQSMECVSEFQYLKYLNAKHKDYLTIITIIPSAGAEASVIRKMAANNNWDWIILSSEEADKLLDAYDVRGYPVFYLIDKEGKLVMSPAMNPSKGFEQHLFRIMRGRGDI